MKKNLALLLTVLLIAALLPGAALAQEGTLEAKTATRTGPGTQYTEDLGTLPSSVRLDVIARVDDGAGWYHVEYTRSGKTYRTYVLQSRVKVEGFIPAEPNEQREDALLSAAKAYYGPGESYAPKPGALAAGTAVTVADVEGEWALCDYREDWRWARGYIHVSSLRDTQAEMDGPGYPELSQPQPTAYVPADPAAQPLNAAALPAVNAAQICFLTMAVDIYAGPGEWYYLQTFREDLAAIGALGAGVRVYGQENGWALIRYPSGEPGEYRYGWVTPQALVGAGDAGLPDLSFSYIPAALKSGAYVAYDPDILSDGGVWLPEGAPVTALGCLNGDPAWVLCQYSRIENGVPVMERAFLPADMLLGQ